MSNSFATANGSMGSLPWSLGATDLKSRAEEIVRAAQHALSELRTSQTPPTEASLLEPLDRVLIGVRDLAYHGSFVFAVHPDAAVRTAGREASEAADRFFNEFRIDEVIYRKIRSIDLARADGPTRFAVSKLLREMRRAGAEKGSEARGKLLKLSNEIDRVSNQYNENIATLERGIDLKDPTELTGLPPDYVAAHPLGPAGTIRISTRYPDFHPVMAYADRPEVRRRLLAEYMNRAYPENEPILTDLLRLRFELATLLGYPEFAAYAIEDKMMERSEAVRTFLERVAGVLKVPALRDLDLLLARKRRDDPSAKRLDLWDGSFSGDGYYDNKLRVEEFGVDSKALRAYLPYGRVRDGLFALCEELFGLRFRRVASETLWHPSVEAYDVTHGDRPLGRIYLDLVPREGKYTHAACFGIREGIAGLQLPQYALVCNFLDPNLPAETARMQYSDVITFFHEFGHLLHGLFAGHGRWLYTTPSYIEWDFVEAPSQLFEEWARDPATLARFARNPDTGEVIPAALLERLRAADALGRSARWLRQVALATVSLRLYDRPPNGVDPSVVFRDVFDRYFPTPMEPEYHPTAAWGHLTGYSACYYTYVWSLVIARDLLEPFRAAGNLTDRTIATRYAKEILMPGSERPARELIASYLGREFDFGAFERWVQEDRSSAATRPVRSPAE